MEKILLYTDTPQIGGAELQMFLLAKFLNKKKFTPVLAASDHQALQKWFQKFEKEGIQTIRLKARHKHSPGNYYQLKKILKQENFNLLHAHVWNPASCRYAFLAAKKYNIPVVTTEHDPFKLSKMKDLFKKRTLKNIKTIVTVSRNNQKILSQLYPEHKNKIKVIHNGIDITWWNSQLLRFSNEDRDKIKTGLFQANKDTLIITSIAELHERKGLKHLIQAMPNVIFAFPNVKLVIAGEGGDRSNLESLIKKLKIHDHVILTGRQNDIPHILKSSNIFVLPSVREAFGFVNLEAMTIPLPIIASKVGGIPEVIDDKKTGLLVPPENSEALSQSLKDLIASPKMRQKMAEAGHAKLLINFTAEKMAEKYEKVYQQNISS